MSIVNNHATQAGIRRAMAAVNKGGMKIGSIKLHSDGTIELISEQSVLATPANDFDRLDAEGLL